ncbi:MAG: hypothetical protein Q9219_006183 [cf. Caloplaca sp. 3 TL-2023]
MRRLVDISLAALIPTVILFHLICAPYTKVEESFNIQATHDILNYGIRDLVFPTKSGRQQLIDHYDHLTFTGSVPRTFVGALALAGASWPFTNLVGDAVNHQMIVRAVLGLWNASCLLYYRNGVANAFGRSVANWFVLFQASGFHIMYYASRALPNFFAFGLVNVALARLLPRTKSSGGALSNDLRSSLVAITVAGIVFRSELALLLVPYAVLLLLSRRLTLTSIVTSGVIGVAIGLLLTVSVDSIFWQRFPLWPELSAFSYNVLHSQSSNWGTSPWHFYFTSALPRLLFNPVVCAVCIPLASSQPALRRQIAELVVPNILYLVTYSFQPHKEWRFVIYVIPPLLTAAALGANWIWTRRAKAAVYRVLSLTLAASIIASFSASTLMLAVSRLNYPGGEALDRLHTLVPLCRSKYPNQDQTAAVNVHMDTLACMTGVTRFLQLPPPPPRLNISTLEQGTNGLLWIYDKTEDEDKLLTPLFWEQFDWALAERPERAIGRWEVVDTVEGYGGFKVVRPGEGHGDEERVSSGMFEAWSLLRARDWKRVMGVVERYGRIITRGWWIGVRMEPRIRILRKEREVVGLGMSGDW